MKYKKLKRGMNKSVSGNTLSAFLYSEEMSCILDVRPIANCKALDSAPLSKITGKTCK